MAVLVIADHDNTVVRDTTLKTIAAAQRLSTEIDVLVLGENAQAAADGAARIAGVRKVLLAESPALDRLIAEAVADVVVPLAASYDAILTPSTSAGKNFSPVSRPSSTSCRSRRNRDRRRQHVRPPDLCWQCVRDCAVGRHAQGDHRPPDRVQGGGRGGRLRDRGALELERAGDRRQVRLRRGGEVRAS
jgi:hypothetical protein